jgi:hypothetical protein
MSCQQINPNGDFGPEPGLAPTSTPGELESDKELADLRRLTATPEPVRAEPAYLFHDGLSES